jgi:CHAT domain-containing protein
MSFPHLRSEPLSVAVVKALNRFIDAPMNQICTLLERDQALLLTDIADRILTTRISNIQESGDLQRVETLKFYRSLLSRAREVGINTACEELAHLVDSNAKESFSLFLRCLAHPTPRQVRRCFEQHLELLEADFDRGLEVYIAYVERNIDQFEALRSQPSTKKPQEMMDTIREMRCHLQILRDARRGGGTVAAFREAYVDIYGGATLDVPSWFEEKEAQLEVSQHGEASERNETEYITILRNLIRQSQDNPQVAPETLAELHYILAQTLLQQNLYIRDPQPYETAIQACEVALQVYTHARYPHRHAIVQKCLGDLYLQRVEGIRKENLERAISYYQGALQQLTKEAFPRMWAETQVDLSWAYRERIEGRAKENLEQALAYAKAALHVFTRENFPTEWASAQHALANVHFFRIEGIRKDNLELAIMHFYAALQAITREKSPHSWATIHYSLGNSYTERIEGNHKDNIEQAIAHFNAALKVYAHQAFMLDLAKVQFGLGSAYLLRIEGVQRDNIEQAIEYYNNALEVVTPDTSPQEWVAIQHNLATAYGRRIEGERRSNLEQAIGHFEEALGVCTRELDPYRWAQIQFSLGNAYSVRIDGKERDNLQRAITFYQYALQIFTHDTFPWEGALAQSQLGAAYSANFEEEKAIESYKAALRYFTRKNFPYDWAGIQRNLGIAYRDRTLGEKHDNLRRAIVCHKAALRIHTRGAYSLEWASTEHSLGITYSKCIDGDREKNLQNAIECFDAALQIYTLDTHPREYRDIQSSRGGVEAERENWAAAHAAYMEVSKAENILLPLGAGVVGHDIILKESGDATTHDGFALIRLQRLTEAALAIERGRARGLGEALALDVADPKLITNIERRSHYEEARHRLITAQTALNTPVITPQVVFGQHHVLELSEEEKRQINLELTRVYHEARRAFDSVIAEIRAAQDPSDFLIDMVEVSTLFRAAAHGEAGHAIIYLAATPWGGYALAVMNANPHLSLSSRIAALELPEFTSAFLHDLIDTRLTEETLSVIGGFAHAQEGGEAALAMLLDWHDETFREAASALHMACVAAKKTSTLDESAQQILSIPNLAPLLDKPFRELEDLEKLILAENLGNKFLSRELQRCLPLLSGAVISPLLDWLQMEGVMSLTLVPAGYLAAFPLTAVPLADGRTLGETLQASVAPSARSLLKAESTKIERRGVYALGNPDLGDPDLDLYWGEVEAYILALLAQNLNLFAKAQVRQQATRSWLAEAMQRGYIVDASCHGSFDIDDFLKTALHLAEDQQLTLADMLSHTIDLRGLRLIILSACQTAVLDLRGAVNEVRSLTAGMLQAGAKAVLAPLWSVEELPTYLLMARFAQLWFPSIESKPPAAALIEAQHWLRTITNRGLLAWYSESIPTPTEQELQQFTDAREKEQAKKLIQAKEFLEKWVEKIWRGNLDAVLFADPFFWAGFQITGW